MPLDAIAIRALTNELSDKIVGCRIDKVQQPERDEIVLVLRGVNVNARLIISANSANPRIHLTNIQKENPVEAPMFCMLLRKHILGGRIISISQMGLERIIDIAIESRNELHDITTKHIICEIMGRNSNIIFTDSNMKIIDSIKHIDITVSSIRNILPGLTYVVPPQGDRIDPMQSELSAFEDILFNAAQGKDIDKAIVEGICGISPLLAREAVYAATGNSNLFVGEIPSGIKKEIAKNLFSLFERVRNNNFMPCMILKDGKTKDFSALEIKQYSSDVEIKKMDTMNEVLEEYYRLRDNQERMRQRTMSINKILTNAFERCSKKLNIHQENLKSTEDRDKYKIMGDLIIANLYRINKGDKELVAQNYYDDEAKEIKIPLDVTKTPSQNAQSYYKKYNKAKNSIDVTKKQIEITLNEMEYLQSVLHALESAQNPQELVEIRMELEMGGYIKNTDKKKRKSSNITRPMEFEYEGYTIFAGKNNVQNDYLTLKMGRSRDMWLHTKKIAGSHVIIKYKDGEFPPKVIEMAAIIAASNSKAKNSSSVEVDYCPVNHVKKPNGAKAGMVIYEGYNTAVVTPDENLVNSLRK